jgi:tellurite resistance protein TehA-like permease
METGIGMNVGNVVSSCPVAAFSSVMGICGLGLCWRAAAQVLSAPHAIGEGLIALAAALFVVLGHDVYPEAVQRT